MFEKKYTPQNIQQEILQKQNRKKLFANKEIKKAGEKNTVSLLASPIILDQEHTSYGQLLQKIKEDSMARYRRMLGKQVQWYPCFGYQKSNKAGATTKHTMTQWIKELEKQEEKRIKDMIQVGMGFDADHVQNLIAPLMTRKIRNFVDFCIEKGRIRQDTAINYRCNRRQTNISQDEITRKKTKCKLYTIKYFVDTKNITLLIKTMTPETIFGDVALAVHPEDRRYKKLIGQKVIIPIVNKTIPIIGEETVDITKHNGVVRVTPCHDIRGLEVAKKHKLNLKKFAIDHNGCFTKLAGDFAEKKVADFFDNIIQNLDDIHNLESVQQIEHEIPTDKIYGEKLQPILFPQWFFYPPEEIAEQGYTQHILQNIEIYPSIYKELREKNADNTSFTSRPISKKEMLGISLPIRENKSETYFLSEHAILNMPKSKIKNKRLIPTLLLFNIIADQRMSPQFSIDELIEVLLTPIGEEKCLGEAYMEAFASDLRRGYASEINEFLKLFVYASKDIGSAKGKGLVNYEKFASQLMNILEKTAGVLCKKGGRYTFDAAQILHTKEEIRPSDEKIDSNLALSILLLENAGILSDKQAEKTIFLGEEKEKNTVIKTCILGKILTKKLPLQEIFLFPDAKICKKEVREEMMEKRGSDVIRMQGILQHAWEGGKITDVEGEKYLAFINKMRNACRYIFFSYIDNPKRRKPLVINLMEIGTYLEKRLSKLEPNEYRMLCRVKDLYTQMPEHLNKNSLAEFGQKVIDCIKRDFCDKYLEIIKIRNTEFTEKISAFCVGTLLQILYPIAPFFTEALRNFFNFDCGIHQQKYTQFLDNATKNYKTQLFMDIMDKCILLRERTNQAKHQKVDIAFLASLDFLQYIRHNEDIVAKLINTDQINYVNNEKELQKYETDSIIDVTIGIKGIAKPLKPVEGKESRKQELEKKQERLQEIRHLTAQLSLDSKNRKLVAAKKEEMELLKKDIEKLEYAIKKSKMNEK